MLALVSNQPSNERGMLRSVADGLSLVRKIVHRNASDILCFHHPLTKFREVLASGLYKLDKMTLDLDIAGLGEEKRRSHDRRGRSNRTQISNRRDEQTRFHSGITQKIVHYKHIYLGDPAS